MVKLSIESKFSHPLPSSLDRRFNWINFGRSCKFARVRTTPGAGLIRTCTLTTIRFETKVIQIGRKCHKEASERRGSTNVRKLHAGACILEKPASASGIYSLCCWWNFISIVTATTINTARHMAFVPGAVKVCWREPLKSTAFRDSPPNHMSYLLSTTRICSINLLLLLNNLEICYCWTRKLKKDRPVSTVLTSWCESFRINQPRHKTYSKEAPTATITQTFDHGGVVNSDWFSDRALKVLNISIVTRTDNAIVDAWLLWKTSAHEMSANNSGDDSHSRWCVSWK